ncbi:YtxH domain-containing protein [Priestia megaterium]|nr:YtxH domain-containing protein [Priestia megaterium]
MGQRKNKLIDGIVIGALVGAAISLFDKETRQSVVRGSKAVKDKTVTMIQNPSIVTEALKEKYEAVRTTIEQVSEDVTFVAGKVEQLKETTPEVVKAVKNTQQAFSPKHGHDEQK